MQHDGRYHPEGGTGSGCQGDRPSSYDDDRDRRDIEGRHQIGGDEHCLQVSSDDVLMLKALEEDGDERDDDRQEVDHQYCRIL